MSILTTTTLPEVVAADSIPSNTGPICILKIWVAVVNKDNGDGDALQESNHTTEYKIKSNTYTRFIETLNGIHEGEQKTGKIEESDAFIFVKYNFKKHLPFWEKRTIRPNETVS